MDTTTSAYRLLTLIALSGECSVDVLSYMGISTSYGEKLITRLKEENLIKTHYRDRLRGYRLTNKAKQLLLQENPDRFSFYLSGNSDTNRPRSDYPRRLRLQQTSIVYAMLLHAGIPLFGMKNRFCSGMARKACRTFPRRSFITPGKSKRLARKRLRLTTQGLSAYCLHPTASMPCSIRAMLF